MMELKQILERDGGQIAPKRSGGEPGEPERSAGAICPPAAAAAGTGRRLPDPEVSAKGIRRRYTAPYKLRILKEADHCGPGGIGALLRREGLYSSHLTTWRKQREAGEIGGLQPRKRGKKPMARNPLTGEYERLQRENERLGKRLKQAETIIDVQKKLCEAWGLATAQLESSGRNE
jgi:transposase